MKRTLGVLLTIAVLIGIFPTASFATGTNAQQNETVTYSIFDAIIPFSNMVDCQRTTYTTVGKMQQLNRFDYVYSANEDSQISDLVSDVVENPDDYYYRFSEEVDGGITLTMYKYGDSAYSYELSQNGYIQTYGDNCFLYEADGYGTFVSFRDKEYHMCDNHTHAKNYPHEEENSIDSSRKACILCGCGETFIIKGYEPSIADLKALPIVEGLVEIDHTHGYDETGKCPCGKYDNTTEIDKADAGIYSDVVVDGLADALEDNLLEDSSVSVLLKVSEDTSATAEKDAITQLANGQEIDFIELSLLKSVNGGALQDIGSQNDNLLKIKIPFDATGKQNIAVYRYHGSAAEKLSTTANADGEYFEVDAGYIIIYAKKFSTYAIGYTIESSSGTHANHCVCGATHTSIGNHTTEENPTWVAISSADDFTKNKDSGYYYLTDDIEVSAKWEFTKQRDIVLCLNGYDITYTGSSNVSFIPGSKALNFTLTDCKAEAGSISGFKNTYGGAINAKKTFTMYNGKITGNTASQGGGVYVDENATFYMYGGEITGNTASSIGGGVYIKGSMEVAGAPVVNNNENSNTSTTYPSSMYKYTKNIYSSTGAITVGTGGLATGAQLDVTPMFPVSSSESPAAVATIATGCTSDLSAYFTYTSGFNYTKQYDATEGKVQLVYAPVKYTVTFNMQGHGTQVEEQSVETGTYATEPSPAPTAQGYTFGGWYTTPECGYWDDFIFDFFKITEDKTLYAKWTLNSPTISGAEGYTADYDGASHEISVTANSASNLSYSYQWYKGGKAEENEMNGATSATYSVKNVADSGTYYCKVTVSDGSSTNSSWSDAVTVAISKASVAVPTVSSKFYTGENLVADISDTVDYIVTTNEGGIAVDEYDVVLTLKDSANYKWADGTETAEKTIIFRIVQSGTEFTDVKVLNGGSESTAFTYGDTITVKVKPAATGNAVPSLMMLMSVSDPTENQMALYLGDTQVSDASSADGEGYYTMTVDTTEGVLPIGGSITLSAKYVGNTNMADYSMPVTLTLSKASQSAPETPAAVGETIKGKNDGKITGVTDAMEYKKQGDADYIAISGTEIADLTAGTYLVRYKETDSYLASPDNQLVVADGALITVTFASNGGSAVDSQTCEYNQTITAPDAPTKEGFEFIAWYADDTLTTKWDFVNTITETKTLYAKWVQGTVSDHEDHVDEVEAEGLNDIAKAEETDIKLVVQTEPITEGDTEQTAIKDITDAPDNFNFYDITLEKSTGGYVTDASSAIEIKLPYDFSRKTNIKVYRYHNGMPEELEQLEAKATAPYVDGKCFIDAANNCIYIYSSKFSTYAVAYDTVRSSSGGGVTRYTVKFDTDGGSKIANKTVTRNSKIAEPTVPEKEGYTFMGWFADEEFTTAYDFTAKVTKSFTLYAKWEKVNDEKEENPDTHNCPSKSFDDLDVNLWYHLDVDYVLENGLMKGTDKRTFAPNDNLTRAMLVTVLYRMENEPSTNRSIPFSDVDMGAYYANAVSWAKQNGIVNGVTETEFAPNDNITREQIAAIMYRYAQYKGMDAVTLEENLHFADSNEISEYAVSSMNWAVGTGLINGKSESILAPKDNATRAEAAAILHRFMEAN